MNTENTDECQTSDEDLRLAAELWDESDLLGTDRAFLKVAMRASLRRPIHRDIQRQLADLRSTRNCERAVPVLNLGTRVIAMLQMDGAGPEPGESASWREPTGFHLLQVIARLDAWAPNSQCTTGRNSATRFHQKRNGGSSTSSARSRC
jgi:hypothetical protein